MNAYDPQPIDYQAVKLAAEKEVHDERFGRAVEKEKRRIRERLGRRRWWHALFPWRVLFKIERIK